MSVVISNEEVGPCRRQVKVEVPAPAVAAETDRVVQEYRRQTKLPGFRKGKVPEGVIRNRFEEDIRKEVIDRLLPRYWRQAQAEANLQPLLSPEVESVDFGEDAAMTFVASVETRPEIELGDIENFDLPDPGTEPSDEEVNATLEGVREDLADWNEVERGASRGDRVMGRIVEIDSDGNLLGEEQPVGFEVGGETVWEELTLAVNDLKAESVTEFSRTSGEGEDVQTQTFRLTVGQVQERELPAADDALAKRAGEFGSLEEFKSEIHQRLTKHKEQERSGARRRAVLEQLRERHPIELPTGVVEHETENLLREYAETLASQGVDVEKAQIEWKEMAERLRPQAEQRVHVRLLLDEIAERGEIRVAEEELETTLSMIAKAQGQTTVAIRQAMDRDGRLGMLRRQILHDKVIRNLLGEEEKPVEEESAPAPEASDDATAESASDES